MSPAVLARPTDTDTDTARPTPGRRRSHRAAIALVVTTAVAVVLVTGTTGAELIRGQLGHDGTASYPGIGRDDGWLGDRTVTAADTSEPAIAHLDPELLAALQQATRDAARDGIHVDVNSGWRSRAYQRALLQAAVVRYGSYREARAWVNTPGRSTHVRGEAVDVGPSGAYEWLSRHGHEYGLCRTYANEPWHFELLVQAGRPCPPVLARDASAGSGQR